MATAITWSSTYTGTASPDDVLAAKKLIREANARITAENAVLAAQDPPGTPIPLYSDVGAALKTSALAIMSKNQSSWWASYTQQAKDDVTRITPDDKSKALAYINTRLNAGETMEQILADLAPA